MIYVNFLYQDCLNDLSVAKVATDTNRYVVHELSS